MYDVISFGSITVDVFMDTEAKEKRGKIMYPVGTKILVNDLDFQTGGCGMNVAIALRKLGLKSALLGRYGKDANGNIIEEALKREGVDFVGPKPEGKTGYGIILDSIRHNRTILHFRGASNHVRTGGLNKGRLKAKWFYFASAMSESLKTQKDLTALAARNGTKIAYNPGIRECEKGKRHIGRILRATELFIANAEESSALSGKDDKMEMLKAIRSMGPRVVCITDGARETVCYDGMYFYTLKPHNTRLVERTGAGDAFSAGMVAGMARGMGIEMSMQMGLADSESVIRYVGARNKLLSWKEMMSTIKRNPGKLRKVKA